MSSCKQVKFFYEVFRRLRPGNPLMALYGKQKQLKRVGIYEEFCRKSNAILFATDIAARGLDFPEVHWVVQFDCPEDSSTYVHRVGRTARLEKDGQALLVLLPSEEEEMIKELEAKKVPIQQIRPDPKKLQSIQKKLASYCAQSQEVKHWAQRSIVSYARSVFLQSNKKIFDVHKLPIKEYATSIGLPVPPRIRFMKKLEKQIGSAAKDAERDKMVKKSIKGQKLGNYEDSESSGSEDENQPDNGKEKKNKIVNMKIDSNANEEDDDILVLKKKHFHDDASDDDIKMDELLESPSKDLKKQKTRKETKATLAKKMMHKGIKLNTKIVFDDEGEMEQVEEPTIPSDKSDDDDDDSNDVTHRLKPVDIKDMKTKDVGGINIKNMKRKLGKEDKMDRQAERERIKRKHKDIKLKKRKERQVGTDMDAVIIGAADDVQESDAEEFSEENEQHEVLRKNSPKKKRKMEQEEQEESDNDNLQDDEELALQLISGLE
eukprot:Seg900.7 transcript_id=Seg900.7/GoldUCD/mRNA.D3Y31 product="putative ATP-dependent RNA helicase DDX10" protein_id=Seg900.7/GoldUCD/D3Y31